MVTLTRLWQYLSGFSTVKLFPFSFFLNLFYISFLWKISLGSVHSQSSGELSSTSQRGETYTNYSEFFCKEDLPSLPHLFVSSIITSVWTHGYLFYVLDYNPILLFVLLLILA